MILQYFKKKENEYKIEAEKLYLEIIHKARSIVKKNYFIEINFDSSFEIVTILLVFYIKNFNKDNLIKKKFNEELIKIFISDLDRSIREIGIGDMSIGKHVKKYVKKFYYRVKILDPLINNDLLSNEFIDYLNSLKLINIYNIEVMRQDLIVIFKELKKKVSNSVN